MTEKKEKDLLETAVRASVRAGKKIMEIYDTGFDIEYKKDNSPLTLADKASHDIISSYLKPTGIPVLSEEGKDIGFDERKKWKTFWMVDPLDGTKEFIKRNGEFTVNIALIENEVPVMGIIYIPVQKILYFASETTGALKCEAIQDEDAGLDQLTNSGNRLPIQNSRKNYIIIGSKSHMNAETEAYIGKLKAMHGDVEILSKGSSLKITMVAEGSADIYPRFAPTMEWDIAAGHTIARIAGAKVINHETGNELTYNKESLVNPWFIVRRD